MASARLTHHESEAEIDDFLVQSFPGEALEQHLAGDPAEIVARDMHRGQSRRDQRREIAVAERRNGEVPRDGDPEFAAREHEPDRHRVPDAEYGINSAPR